MESDSISARDEVDRLPSPHPLAASAHTGRPLRDPRPRVSSTPVIKIVHKIGSSYFGELSLEQAAKVVRQRRNIELTLFPR